MMASAGAPRPYSPHDSAKPGHRRNRAQRRTLARLQGFARMVVRKRGLSAMNEIVAEALMTALDHGKPQMVSTQHLAQRAWERGARGRFNDARPSHGAVSYVLEQLRAAEVITWAKAYNPHQHGGKLAPRDRCKLYPRERRGPDGSKGPRHLPRKIELRGQARTIAATGFGRSESGTDRTANQEVTVLPSRSCHSADLPRGGASPPSPPTAAFEGGGSADLENTAAQTLAQLQDPDLREWFINHQLRRTDGT